MIKYDKTVPQEIRDLLGNKEYRFLSTWQFRSGWKDFKVNKYLGSFSTVLPVTQTRRIDLSDLETYSCEELITRLQEYISDPEYISSRLVEDYNYDRDSSASIYYIELTLKKEPTQKEIDEHEKLKLQYEEEKELAIKLEKLVKNLVKKEKDANLVQEKIKLENELAEINSRLKKLGK